jgi:hypothetical protein
MIPWIGYQGPMCERSYGNIPLDFCDQQGA